MTPAALQLAMDVRDLLRSQNCRLVLAESCTAGRVAASLAALPGISEWFCGSFVVYRRDSKTKWLDIPQHLLEDPTAGPVSQAVTTLLAESALRRTPEANVAVAVTGDLGPFAPSATDGALFLAITWRSERQRQKHLETFELIAPKSIEAHVDAKHTARSFYPGSPVERRLQLSSPAPCDERDVTSRLQRLDEATCLVLSFTAEQLTLPPKVTSD